MHQQLSWREHVTPPGHPVGDRTIVVPNWKPLVWNDPVGFPLRQQPDKRFLCSSQRRKIGLSGSPKTTDLFPVDHCSHSDRIQHLAHAAGLGFGFDVVAVDRQVIPRRHRLATGDQPLLRIKIDGGTFDDLELRLI